MLDLFDGLLGDVDFSTSILVNKAIENANLTEQAREDPAKILVPIRKLDDVSMAENRYSLCSKQRRRSTFIKGNASDHGSLGIEGMDQMMASVRRLVRVHIQPFGFKGDPIIAELYYTLLPDQTRYKLGVIRLSKKRLIFSSGEWQYLKPDLRLQLLCELKNWGLIPNEMIRDCNLPFKGVTKFCHPQMQDFLRLQISKGENHTMPYAVTLDQRPHKPCEVDTVRNARTRDVKKFIPIGKQHDRELQHLRSRAVASENALIRANRDLKRLTEDREALLTAKPSQKPSVKTATGKVIDLTGRVK